MAFDGVQYLNTTVFATLKGSDHGVGVFAVRKIPEGIKISDYDFDNKGSIKDFRFTREQFDQLLPQIQQLILDRMIFDTGKPLRFISPNGNAILRSFINHSDTPNTDGRYAIEDIEEGEELTFDYNDILSNASDISREHMSFVWK